MWTSALAPCLDIPNMILVLTIVLTSPLVQVLLLCYRNNKLLPNKEGINVYIYKIHLSLSLSVCAHMCTWACEYGGQGLMSVVSLDSSPAYILGTVFQWLSSSLIYLHWFTFELQRSSWLCLPSVGGWQACTSKLCPLHGSSCLHSEHLTHWVTSPAPGKKIFSPSILGFSDIALIHSPKCFISVYYTSHAFIDKDKRWTSQASLLSEGLHSLKTTWVTFWLRVSNGCGLLFTKHSCW